MARVPPTTTTAPAFPMWTSSFRSAAGGPRLDSILRDALPRGLPSVRVPNRGLRGLRLNPAHALRTVVPEAVDRAHAGEHDVAGTQRVCPAVELRGALPREEEVRL